MFTRKLSKAKADDVHEKFVDFRLDTSFRLFCSFRININYPIWWFLWVIWASLRFQCVQSIQTVQSVRLRRSTQTCGQITGTMRMLMILIEAWTFRNSNNINTDETRLFVFIASFAIILIYGCPWIHNVLCLLWLVFNKQYFLFFVTFFFFVKHFNHRWE